MCGLILKLTPVGMHLLYCLWYVVNIIIRHCAMCAWKQLCMIHRHDLISVAQVSDIRSAFDKTLASERFRLNTVDGAP